MNDERNDLAETLREIAKGSRRSKIVRLRECFDLVEEAKAKGASNKEIVAGLKEHGLIFDVPNFKNARSRILKERAMAALLQETAPTDRGKSKNTLHATTSHQPQSTAASTTSAPAAPVIAPSASTKLELVRPPGISDAKWSEMRAQARANNRKQLK